MIILPRESVRFLKESYLTIFLPEALGFFFALPLGDAKATTT